ncbi:S8 family serine peptidase [Paenibacillus sp. FSL R7-0345]|uniref:S8 family serine peptidase n=1 Tax=Paenibacillus sp. FSL R7-0345 TaxID=2954535 RepID=UPI00315B3E1C
MLNTTGELYTEEFKNKKVDVFAPGQDIISSYLNEKMTLDTGVSFATAYTSGYAAILIQEYNQNGQAFDRSSSLHHLKEYSLSVNVIIIP